MTTRMTNERQPVSLWVFLLFLLACVSAAATATDTVWHEIRPPCSQYEHEKEQEALNKCKTPPRRWLWHGRYDDELTWMPDVEDSSTTTQQQLQTKKPRIVVHPMRTNLWNLNVHWNGGRERRQPRIFAKQLEIEFALNGYCKGQTSKGDVLAIGTWEVVPWGVWFTLEDATGYEYTFTAHLHLNSFGDQPKMMQGSIVRYEQVNGQADPEQDRSFVKPTAKWFRPVVGTFSGVGMGKDTADLSYSSRGIGLSQ
jgi:hypothetical protein